jgi:predicted enzyme related to lactoylglutathione lyase
MLRGMAHAVYWADDVTAAKEWYTELLGIAPYFERSGPDGRLAYIEFRIGDYQVELGITDRRFAPPGAPTGPGGVVLDWHVDDLRAALDKALSMGATEHDPVTERGAGFVTASVIDPFGNIIGLMYNPHYLEILAEK